MVSSCLLGKNFVHHVSQTYCWSWHFSAMCSLIERSLTTQQRQDMRHCYDVRKMTLDQAIGQSGTSSQLSGISALLASWVDLTFLLPLDIPMTSGMVNIYNPLESCVHSYFAAAHFSIWATAFWRFPSSSIMRVSAKPTSHFPTLLQNGREVPAQITHLA